MYPKTNATTALMAGLGAPEFCAATRPVRHFDGVSRAASRAL